MLFSISDVSGCENDELTAYDHSTQYIRSFNWPNDYPSDSNCRWIIRSYDAPYIRVEVMNLDLESCCDFLRLYDGDTTHYYSAPDKEFYSTDSYYFSEGSVVTIEFSSDSGVQHSGFQLKYEAVYDRYDGSLLGMILTIVGVGVLVLACCYCCCCRKSK